jgi:hypothetical protein
MAQVARCALVRTGAQRRRAENPHFEEFFSSFLSGPISFRRGAHRVVRTGAQRLREG